MQASYSEDEIKEWLQLSPEERLFESEKLWEEFLIKYPIPQKPFAKSFDSFQDYEEWLKSMGNPMLW